ncbi:MAG: hypothetical protein RLZ12_1035 [Bacillota bacterium]|jgi:hypothetical protein
MSQNEENPSKRLKLDDGHPPFTPFPTGGPLPIAGLPPAPLAYQTQETLPSGLEFSLPVESQMSPFTSETPLQEPLTEPVFSTPRAEAVSPGTPLLPTAGLGTLPPAPLKPTQPVMPRRISRLLLSNGAGGTSLYMWGRLSSRYSTPIITMDPLNANYPRITKIVCSEFRNYALLTDNTLYTWIYPTPATIVPTETWGPNLHIGIKSMSATSKSLYILQEDNNIWEYTPYPSRPSWRKIGSIPNATINFINACSHPSTFNDINNLLAVSADGVLYRYRGITDQFEIIPLAGFVVDVALTSIFNDIKVLVALDNRDIYEFVLSDPTQLIRIPNDSFNYPIKNVALTPHCSFALDSGGQLWSWGKNTYGISGTNEYLDTVNSIPKRILFPMNAKVKELAITKDLPCALALMEDSTTLCTWGINISDLEYPNSPSDIPYLFQPTKFLELEAKLGNPYYEKIGSIFAGNAYFGALTSMSYMTPWLRDHRFWPTTVEVII